MAIIATCKLLCGGPTEFGQECSIRKRGTSCRIATTEEWESCEADRSYAEETLSKFASEKQLSPGFVEARISDGKRTPTAVAAATDVDRGEDLMLEDSAQPVTEESLVPCNWCGSCIQCNCEVGIVAMIDDWALAEDKGRKLSDDEDQSTAAETASICSADTKGTNAETVSICSAETKSNCSKCGPITVRTPLGVVSISPLQLGFSGRWLLNYIEGDFEALMVDAGVSWATRKMARSMSYGTGLAAQIIEQAGNILSIEFQNGPNYNKMKLDLDADEQETINEDGSRIIVRPRWDGQSLHIEGRRLENGLEIQATRRYMDGKYMVIDSRTSSGQIVKRFFISQ